MSAPQMIAMQTSTRVEAGAVNEVMVAGPLVAGLRIEDWLSSAKVFFS